MREISADKITDGVRQACIDACRNLPEDVVDALKRSLEIEESPTTPTSAGTSTNCSAGTSCPRRTVASDVLEQLIENARIAREEQMPICQDTGIALVFVEIGQDAHIVGGNLAEVINEGVRRGYDEGYLRKSVVRHPLERVNTGDNTPAVIYTEIVPGDGLKITVCPKGGGCENMSAARMLTPADGFEGVKRFVVETVGEAGPNPCPPIIVGVGLGGTLEKAAMLSKKAILRRVGEPSSNPIDAELERELLAAVNETGVGPAGYGGRVTALAVHVESYPCHIASLPIAVTLQCHAARHKSFSI